jgi:phospholipid/cholesterol/gamma-HCH transport system substrate-binding protein
VIRRRFGVAGAAFVDIARGTGAPLDWNFAVIDAVTERAPTESVGALIDQVREKIFPILDDTGRATHALAEVAERIDKGEGNIGRLVSNDALMRNVEASVAEVRADVETMGRIAQKLEAAATDVAALVQAANGRDTGVPALLKRVDDILGTLKKTTGELDEAVQRAPQIARNVARGTDDLPSLMTQLQQTAHELELLMTQLRGNWLLGGTPPPAERTPLPPSQVRP